MKRTIVAPLLMTFALLTVGAVAPAQAAWVWGSDTQDELASASQTGLGSFAAASFFGATSSSGGTIWGSQAMTSVFPADSNPRTADASVAYLAFAGWGWSQPTTPSGDVSLTVVFARVASAAAASPTGATSGASASVNGLPTSSPFATGGRMSLYASAPNGNWGSLASTWGNTYSQTYQSLYVVDPDGTERPPANSAEEANAIPYDSHKVSSFVMGGTLKGWGLNFGVDSSLETTYSVSLIYSDHVRRYNVRTHGGPLGGDGFSGGNVSLSSSGGDSSAVAVYQGLLMAH